jgi:hypothetical protein
MTIRHPSAAETRLLGLREPGPPRETPEAARNALAAYLQSWHAITRWYAENDALVDAEKFARLLWRLWMEIYLLDPDAARFVVREGRS